MTKRLKLSVLSKVSPVDTQNHNISNVKSDNETSRFFYVNNVNEEQQKKDTHDNSKPVKSNQHDKNDYVVNEKTSVWYPNHWHEQLNNIRQMRQYSTAPVDEMGCHKCADEAASGPTFRFQSLIALMLSSQTKDQVTYAAMQRLKGANCTAQGIVSLLDDDLGKLIYPVSFWKRKVQYLKNTSKILLEKYNGDIPPNVEELCKLPGVGPKMAYICMQVAWNTVSGIGVDTHVHRISNRLQWVPKPTKTPEETRIFLEAWLPKELWKDINHLLVGFGQEICRPVRPKCSECSNKIICPYTGSKYQF